MPIHASFVNSLEEVANLALGKIGEQAAISDIDTDTGSVAETVRRFIYQVIREVQSEFRWGELTKSVLLSSPMAENDDTYQYTMPSDFLRPASNREQEYVIENGYLFTGTATDFPFKYIRYSEAPAEWSGLLVKCVYFRLALEICMPITENAQKYAALLEEYEKVVFPRACKVGSFDNESPRTRIARGSYSRLRSGIGGAVAAAFNRVIGVIAPGHHHDTDYVSLHGDEQVNTANLQDGSVTAVKLAADSLAVIDTAEQDAKDYADAQDVIASAADLVSAAATADSKDAAVRTALLPNIVQALKQDTQNIEVGTYPAWVAVTGLSASITPRLATSKLRIRLTVQGSSSGEDTQLAFKVMVDGVMAVSPTSPGNRTSVHAVMDRYYYSGGMRCASVDLLIDATTATAKVIAVYACSTSGTGVINKCITDTDNNRFFRAVSTLIVEEIFTA